MLDRTARLIAPLAFTVLLLAHAVKFSGNTIDDAFITYRYAQNLATGNGLTYHPHEPVEGYSNFLWTLLLAGCHAAGFPLELASNVLGIMAGIACLWVVFWLGPEVDDGRPRWFAAWVVVCSSAFAFWCVAGLETSLVALLLLGVVLGLDRGRPGLAGTAAALLIMERPEGTGITLAVAAYGLWSYRTGGTGRAWLVPFARVCLPVLVAYHAGRLAYFGQPLPNTFWAKRLSGLHSWRGGILDLYPLLTEYLPDGILLLVALALTDRGSRGPFRPVAALMIAGCWLAPCSVGGDWMPMYRFPAMTVPLLAVLAQRGFDRLTDGVGPMLGSAARWLGLLFVLLTGLRLFSIPLAQSAHITMQRLLGGLQTQIGLRLAGLPGKAIAVGDIGRIGFFSGKRILDLKGLVSPEAVAEFRKRQADESVVKDPGSGWIFDRSPDWILLIVEPAGQGFRGFFATDRSLMNDPRLTRDYRQVTTARIDGLTVEYQIHCRKDLPLPSNVDRLLTDRSQVEDPGPDGGGR